jgi:two-component system OmpR family response regulator
MVSPELKRILCIDDEEDILQVAKLSLERVGGFEVSVCNASLRSEEEVRRCRPDLVLLDVMMPEMDGPTTYARLKAAGALEGIPVVFMTAKVQPAEVQHYLDLGAIGVVSKPFDPMTLPQQLKSLWKQARESQ